MNTKDGNQKTREQILADIAAAKAAEPPFRAVVDKILLERGFALLRDPLFDRFRAADMLGELSKRLSEREEIFTTYIGPALLPDVLKARSAHLDIGRDIGTVLLSLAGWTDYENLKSTAEYSHSRGPVISETYRIALRKLFDDLIAPPSAAHIRRREASERLVHCHHTITNDLPRTLAALHYSEAMRLCVPEDLARGRTVEYLVDRPPGSVGLPSGPFEVVAKALATELRLDLLEDT